MVGTATGGRLSKKAKLILFRRMIFPKTCMRPELSKKEKRFYGTKQYFWEKEQI